MSNERIETVSKMLTMLSDLAKFVGIASLAAFAVASIAVPDWAQKRLDSLGLQVKEVNAFGLKIAAKETVKAGNDTIKIADALTRAQISISAVKTSLSKGADSLPQSAEASKAIADAISNINNAQAALVSQADALNSMGRAVGLMQDIPPTGWLYVGNFGADGSIRFLSPRIASNGIIRTKDAITGILLKFDAHVVPDGDDCMKLDIKDVPMPDPNAKEVDFIILKASMDQPLEVVQVSECPSIGRGKSVYVQVKVPKDRVRFSPLSKLPQ